MPYAGHHQTFPTNFHGVDASQGAQGPGALPRRAPAFASPSLKRALPRKSLGLRCEDPRPRVAAARAGLDDAMMDIEQHLAHTRIDGHLGRRRSVPYGAAVLTQERAQVPRGLHLVCDGVPGVTRSHASPSGSPVALNISLREEDEVYGNAEDLALAARPPSAKKRYAQEAPPDAEVLAVFQDLSAAKKRRCGRR